MARIDDDDAIADTLEEELIRLIARGAQRSAIPVVCAAAVLAGAAYGKAPTGLVIAWFVLTTLIVIVRRRWLLGALGQPSRTAAQQLHLVAAFGVLMGGSFGASVLFWPYLGDLERAVESTVILGLCAAAVATNLGYRPTFLLYFGASAGPLMLAWLFSGSITREGWIQMALALLIALFGFILTLLARDTFALFGTSFRARMAQRQLNQQLRVALDEAHAASQAKTRFLASASHDLRQPLHTVSLFGAALMMRPLDPRTRQIAENMNTALQSLGSQLDALLDISKLDAGIVAPQPSSFALDQFLEAIESDFVPQCASKGLTLRVECPPRLSCHADPVLLARIVRNLVDNATKYTEAGSVRVAAARLPAATGDAVNGRRWCIDVTDTGIGIPASEQRQVFEEFYQIGNPERDRARGLGLGLSIVSRLAQLMQVSVQLDSAPGRGTTVRLTLPVGVAGEPGLAAIAPDPASMPEMHVLVIDDEQGVRDGMRALLEGWGCSVDCASDTAAAIALAAAARPDIVLADLRLRAGDDGIAAIDRVRQVCAGVPALLVSGDTAPSRLREAIGANLRLLHKPVPAAQLRRAICEEIERSGGSSNADQARTSIVRPRG